MKAAINGSSPTLEYRIQSASLCERINSLVDESLALIEIRSSFEVNQFIELINKSPFPKEWKNRLPAKAEFPMANIRPVICWPVSFAAGNCTAVAMAFAPREVSDNWL